MAQESAPLMTANKLETMLYRAPNFSLLLVPHGGITYVVHAMHPHPHPLSTRLYIVYRTACLLNACTYRRSRRKTTSVRLIRGSPYMYILLFYLQQAHQCKRGCQGDIVAHGYTKRQLQLVKHRMWPPHVQRPC